MIGTIMTIIGICFMVWVALNVVAKLKGVLKYLEYQKSIYVEMYAGRGSRFQPFPKWELTGLERDELRGYMSELPSVDKSKFVDPFSGSLFKRETDYRGFSVHNPRELEGMPYEITVNKGIIRVRKLGKNRYSPFTEEYYEDAKSLEGWLHKQTQEARPRLA